MNKKIIEFCSQHDLQVEGNNAYGIINGFEVTLRYEALNNISPIYVAIAFFADDDKRQIILNKITNLKMKIILAPSGYGISFGLNDLTIKRALIKLENVINNIIDILVSNDAKGIGYCPLCGEETNEENKKTCNIAFGRITLNVNCFNNLNESIKKSQDEYENMPNNYLKGFAGILLGAIAGVASFILLSFIGYISAISSLISIVLGIFLYKKFGGKPNKIMILMSVLVTIATMLLTIFGLYYLSATAYVYEQGLSFKGLDAFNYCMNEIDGFKAEFISNVTFTIFFTLISCVIISLRLLKSIKKPTYIK